jgi:hypothetical protein
MIDYAHKLVEDQKRLANDRPKLKAARADIDTLSQISQAVKQYFPVVEDVED